MLGYLATKFCRFSVFEWTLKDIFVKTTTREEKMQRRSGNSMDCLVKFTAWPSTGGPTGIHVWVNWLHFNHPNNCILKNLSFVLSMLGVRLNCSSMVISIPDRSRRGGPLGQGDVREMRIGTIWAWQSYMKILNLFVNKVKLVLD